MRKSALIPAIGLFVVGLSSAFWLVSAADRSETCACLAMLRLPRMPIS